MVHRYTLAAVLLAALSIPAAAQQTTKSDTSKKTPSGVTVTTSPGSIADTAAKTTTVNPNGPPSNGAQVPSAAQPSAAPSITPPVGENAAAPTTPSTTTPSTMAPSAVTPSTVAPSTMAPSTSPTTPSATGMRAAPAATGAIQPTSGPVKVQVKVAESLANTVKISADSAFALAKASNTAGEISSAELEMTHRRLVYQVKMVKGAGASTVYVDAMTGEVVKDKKFGGLKAAAENQDETKKLYDAKKHAPATKP